MRGRAARQACIAVSRAIPGVLHLDAPGRRHISCRRWHRADPGRSQRGYQTAEADRVLDTLRCAEGATPEARRCRASMATISSEACGLAGQPKALAECRLHVTVNCRPRALLVDRARRHASRLDATSRPIVPQRCEPGGHPEAFRRLGTSIGAGQGARNAQLPFVIKPVARPLDGT